MSNTLAEHAPQMRRDRHSDRLKKTSDEAASIYKRHAEGRISAEEATRLLQDLKRRNRTFLDLLIG